MINSFDAIDDCKAEKYLLAAKFPPIAYSSSSLIAKPLSKEFYTISISTNMNSHTYICLLYSRSLFHMNEFQ